MSIKVKVIKKQRVDEHINEGAPTQQATTAIDAKATNDAINAFVASVMNNVKNVCTIDNIGKSIPQISTAKNMENSPYKDVITNLENEIKTMAQINIDATNTESIKSAMTAFSNIVNGLETLNGEIAKNASNDTNTQQNQQTQQTQDNNQQANATPQNNTQQPQANTQNQTAQNQTAQQPQNNNQQANAQPQA